MGERKKAEADRVVKHKKEQERKSKFSGAFAMDDDDEDEDRQSKFLAPARTGEKTARFDVARTSQLSIASATQAPGTGSVGSDLGKAIGFDGVNDPAEAFMRLQERKRKGRRSEFGGPPRGCSPWRDGKKGISHAKERD